MKIEVVVLELFLVVSTLETIPEEERTTIYFVNSS